MVIGSSTVTVAGVWEEANKLADSKLLGQKFPYSVVRSKWIKTHKSLDFSSHNLIIASDNLLKIFDRYFCNDLLLFAYICPHQFSSVY